MANNEGTSSSSISQVHIRSMLNSMWTSFERQNIMLKIYEN